MHPASDSPPFQGGAGGGCNRERRANAAHASYGIAENMVRSSFNASTLPLPPPCKGGDFRCGLHRAYRILRPRQLTSGQNGLTAQYESSLQVTSSFFVPFRVLRGQSYFFGASVGGLAASVGRFTVPAPPSCIRALLARFTASGSSWRSSSSLSLASGSGQARR
jgi:hypothetical protein